MAVEINFAAAFIDGHSGPYAPRRLLGVRVRRLCLWHRLLLNAVESPFVSQERVTFWDIRTAVGIFRLEFGDSDIRRPWLIPALLYSCALVAHIVRLGKDDEHGHNALQRMITKQAKRIFSHSGDYLQFPEYSVIPMASSSNKPSPTRGHAPDEIEHVGELVQWAGWPEAYIWNMPLGRANWYRVLARRAAGSDVDFITPEEKEFMAKLPEEFRVKKNA